MKEQIQKVKMVDIKSVIEHFRAFFVHISQQQTKPRQPHVLFITMEVGTHSKKLKQILELDPKRHLASPTILMPADVSKADKSIPQSKPFNTYLFYRRIQGQSKHFPGVSFRKKEK